MNLGPRIDTLYTPTLMTLDKALDLVIKLNSDTLEDWRYVVDADVKSGLAKIEVIDEDGSPVVQKWNIKNNTQYFS